MAHPYSNDRIYLREDDDPAEVAAGRVHRFAGRIGYFLLAVFLCPMLLFSILDGESHVMMFWSLLGMGEGPMAIWTLLPLGAGLAALGARRVRSDTAMCAALVLTGAVGLATLCLLPLEEEGMLLGAALTLPSSIVWPFLAVLAAGLAIAVGNRVRATVGDSRAPTYLMAAGGALFLGVLCMPFVDGQSPLGCLVSTTEWRRDALGNFFVLGFAAYGVAALTAPLPLSTHALASRGITSVNWLLLIGMPLAVVAQRTADASGYEAAFTGGSSTSVVLWAFKTFGLFFGLTLLIARGAAGWLTIRVGRRIGAATGSPHA
ncbi:MAG: hypothetical protein ACKVX7_14960 [Planctomycetota bacterium]